MKDYRKLSKITLCIPFFLIFACSNSKVRVQVYTGEALGTTYQIKFFHTEEIDMEKGLDSIFRLMNSSMSTYQADSDISRINAGDTSVIVDENFREVFEQSHQIYQESEGYFDPTVGKIVNVFGFGPEAGEESVGQDKIDSLMRFVGFSKLKLTPNNRVEKEYREIFIDFNAIAKGYTVDVIARYLDKNNVADYLVEVGGELTARGINRDRNEVWVVGIDNPLQKPGDRSLQAAVKLKDRAMATSGNYRKFKTDPVTGQAFVHTINPHTGLAEKSNLLSASVLAENCALADGYATAFMALGFELSVEMLKRLKNVDAFFIYASDANEAEVYSTQGFQDNLIQE